MKMKHYYDDCRDHCSFFKKFGYCTLACFPFNKAPINPDEHRKALKVVKDTAASDRLIYDVSKLQREHKLLPLSFHDLKYLLKRKRSAD